MNRVFRDKLATSKPRSPRRRSAKIRLRRNSAFRGGLPKDFSTSRLTEYYSSTGSGGAAGDTYDDDTSISYSGAASEILTVDSNDAFCRWDAFGRRVGSSQILFPLREGQNEGVVDFQVGQPTFADYPAGTSESSPTSNDVDGSYIDEIIRRTGSGGNRYYHRNGQHSITALTGASGTIVERNRHTAYGQPTFFDGSGTTISASAENNRYTYEI